jgi:hypothetical protein
LRNFTRRVDQSGKTTEVPGRWSAECSNPRCPSHFGRA